LPQAYLSRLKPGGRLFAIVGEGPAMAATLITQVSPGAQRTDSLFETVSKPLDNAAQPERFVF
jgi:protein-L-isoaspartate(D-aspartate) O-methyltransferase